MPDNGVQGPWSLNQLGDFAGDEDVEVAAAVVGAAHLLGAQCPLGAWLPLALEAVAAPKLPEPSRANALVILSALLYGAGRSQQPIVFSMKGAY